MSSISLCVTWLQIEKACGTVWEHSVCSHPCAPAAEVEKLSLLLWLHIVLQCMVPLFRAGVGALGLKTEQGEAKIWVKRGMLELSLA